MGPRAELPENVLGWTCRVVCTDYGIQRYDRLRNDVVEAALKTERDILAGL